MIRNFLFSIFFFSGIILISIIFLPALILPQKFTLFGGTLMGYWAAICYVSYTHLRAHETMAHLL